jgi:hypothetical protein
MPAKHSPAGLAAQAVTRSPRSRAVRSGRADAPTWPLTAHAACARTSRWARRRPAYRQRAVGSRCAARFSDSSGSPRSAARIACRRRASPNTRRCRRHSGRQASVAWTSSRTTARSLLVGGPVGLGRLWMGHVKHATCCSADGDDARNGPCNDVRPLRAIREVVLFVPGQAGWLRLHLFVIWGKGSAYGLGEIRRKTRDGMPGAGEFTVRR